MPRWLCFRCPPPGISGEELRGEPQGAQHVGLGGKKGWSRHQALSYNSLCWQAVQSPVRGVSCLPDTPCRHLRRYGV